MFVLTGIRTAQYDQIMRWWGSRLVQWLLQSYTLSLIVIYFYPASPATLVLTLASTRGHSPTQMLPVSFPASPPTAWVQPPTWASPVSIPVYRLPAMPLYPPLVPTVWLSLPITSESLVSMKFLPGLPEVVYLAPPGATMPLSCDCLLLRPYLQHILQISVAKRPTAPYFPVVSLFRSSLTAPEVIVEAYRLAKPRDSSFILLKDIF